MKKYNKYYCTSKDKLVSGELFPIYFNNAQKPIMESPNGIFSMSEDDIAKNLEAIGRVGIKGKREMFDTSLLEEI